MTSHASAEISGNPHVNQEMWEWWLVIFLALVAAAFGAYGLWIYEAARGAPPDIFSVGYHTLQLFVLHSPHLDNPVPWQLNLGRWLSAVVVLATAARALFSVFRSECRLLATKLFRRKHVIICGLGQVGMQLALEYRRKGDRVVAIEAHGTPAQITTAHNAKIAVIRGDACNPGTMRRAALGSASMIVAVCDDDQKNVAIAAVAGEMLHGRPENAPTVECWLFIADPRLRLIFQREQLFPHTGPHYKVNVRGLDLFELSARQVLRLHPIDYDRISEADLRVVHLVIVGFGSMGRNLALQAARIGHFANFIKLRVTVIERAGSARTETFLAHYPRFGDICDFTSVTVPMSDDQLDPDAVLRALPPHNEESELLTVAVCWETARTVMDEEDFLTGIERDDPTNLSLALAIPSQRSRQVLVFQTRGMGFGALFPVNGRGSAIGQYTFPFGMHEDTWSRDALLNEREDAIAQILHDSYYQSQIEEGNKRGAWASLYPWEELPEHFRDSNRRAADHIRVKLRAIGYRVVDEADNNRVSLRSIPEEYVNLLARMEHASWCAEWLLKSYSYGKRDDVKKTHPNLLPWERLDEKTQKLDTDQVRAIPDALTKARYWTYPQVT